MSERRRDIPDGIFHFGIGREEAGG